jgi:hypothetical protein
VSGGLTTTRTTPGVPGGWTILWQRTSSYAELWIDGVSVRSSQPTCKVTSSVTSSPGSVSGPRRSAGQAGRTAVLSGPAAVPVSRSARPGAATVSPTPGISGPNGSVSSASASLQQSLANRLRADTHSRGSTLYSLIWKDVVTPAGRLISRLRASALRTSGSGSGGSGWATPAERDYRTPNHRMYAERGGGPKGEQLQNQVAHLIPGASLNGLTAATAGGGLLNPDHSRWLQGIPATWPGCAPTATRSTRSRRPL